MKTTSLVPTAILAIAHGLTASPSIVSSGNYRTGATFEALNIADSADQNRPAERARSER